MFLATFCCFEVTIFCVQHLKLWFEITLVCLVLSVLEVFLSVLLIDRRCFSMLVGY